VSSTFDSIPFVRDYLQKEIEGQLRILLMDELPAIIHRLSLRLWVPEYRAREDQELLKAESPPKEEKVVDPLASPPQDPVDSTGNVLNSAAIASLALDSGLETQSLFSQKNLVRLATLNDSNRTLSLFTPSIRDAVFRAWAGPTERGEAPGLNTPATPHSPALSKTHSHTGSTSTTYTFQDQSSGRPPLSSAGSYNSGLPVGAGRHSKAHASRKRKKRVVNLRRTSSNCDLESVSGDSLFSGSTSTSASSAFSPPPPLPEEKDDEPVTPPQSPNSRVKLGKTRERNDVQIFPPLVPLTPSRRPVHHSPLNPEVHHASSQPSSLESSLHSSGLSNSQDLDATPRASRILQPPSPNLSLPQELYPPSGPSSHPHSYPPEKQASGASSHIHPEAHPPPPPLPAYIESLLSPSSGSGILEQAWMMKMAGEIARRVQDEKLSSGDGSHNGFWESSHRAVGRDQYVPPPAYRQ
jgi:mitochondrial distribution and morphology protein 34